MIMVVFGSPMCQGWGGVSFGFCCVVQQSYVVCVIIYIIRSEGMKGVGGDSGASLVGSMNFQA